MKKKCKYISMFSLSLSFSLERKSEEDARCGDGESNQLIATAYFSLNILLIFFGVHIYK